MLAGAGRRTTSFPSRSHVCVTSPTLLFACVEELRWLVLDEADRLLDLGFEKKIAEVSCCN